MSVLQQLLNQRSVFRGKVPAPPVAVRPSGYELLDHSLGGGLPCSGACELRSSTGVGELRFLLPTLLPDLPACQRLAIINAPGQLCGDFWQGAGAALKQLWVIQPESTQTALWSAEQCLQNGCCRAVLLWNDTLNTGQARRLQLAAQSGGAVLWLLREPHRVRQSLPLTLSLTLEGQPRGLRVSINKRQGGWPAGPIVIDWSERWPDLSIRPLPANVRPLQIPQKRRA